MIRCSCSTPCSHSCNETHNMFPLHGCPLTLCSSGDSLSGNTLTASLEEGQRKQSRLQRRGLHPGPKSELTREGDVHTGCILSLLCSLDIQAIVQRPDMEHLGIAVNKRYLLLPVSRCFYALQVSLEIRGPVVSISRAQMGHSQLQVTTFS